MRMRQNGDRKKKVEKELIKTHKRTRSLFLKQQKKERENNTLAERRRELDTGNRVEVRKVKKEYIEGSRRCRAEKSRLERYIKYEG